MRRAVKLLDREAELSRLGALIDAAAAGTGKLLLVEGEAGIGKTELLNSARRSATDRGLTVLSARGGELERDFPYGIARQLFEPALHTASPERRHALLAGAARLAAPLLDLPVGGPAMAPSADPSFTVQHGLYWLAANLADDGPVLIVVDDVHWSDTPSLRWLVYLARRLEGLPIAILLALRVGEPDSPETLLDALRAEPLVEALAPTAVSEKAVSGFIQNELGSPGELTFRAACHEVTGGNPYLLSELLSALRAENIAPVDEAAGRVRDLAPVGVSRSVLVRLARLPAACQLLAEAISVLDTDADLHRATRLADLDKLDGEAATDALAAARIVAQTHGLRFLHPLMRSAVYSQIPRARRAAMHGRAARLLDADGAGPDRTALHLLVSEPAGDPWATETLRAAASRAMSGGASEEAIALLRRALDEPPPAPERPFVLQELGSAEMLAQRPDCLEHLRAALDLTRDPRKRAEIALFLGRAQILSGRPHEAVATIDTAVAELGDVDRELRLRLEAGGVGAALLDRELRPLATARLERLRGELSGEGPAERLLLAELAVDICMKGESAIRTIELAERALADGRLLAEETSDSQIFTNTVCALALSDQLERAYKIFSDAVAEAQGRGSSVGFAIASCMRSFTAFRLGRLSEAEVDARAALRLSDSPSLAAIHGYSIGFLVDALLERGEIEDAATAIRQAPPGWPALSLHHVNYLFAARGYLRIALGELEEGVEDLLECGRRQAAWGIPNPSWFPWRSRAALALDRLGAREDALRLAGEELELARAFGAPRAIGIALRALGTIEGKGRGLEFLADAVGILNESPARLELAHAMVELGAALRRGNQRATAREPLGEALELAYRCGAMPLAERAREELLAAGSRPRRIARRGVDALTPSERRVAHMAADGLSNPQIAQALFVTRKTVEAHLQAVYRKLDIGGREALSRALEEDPTPALDNAIPLRTARARP